MGKMMVGINKPQWLLITTGTMTVLVTNAIGMWQYFLFYELRRIELPELYESYSCGNPWPKIIPETTFIVVLLFILGGLPVYMSRMSFFQELPLRLKYASELLIAIVIGFVLVIISVSFSSMWVYDFWCGSLVGLLRSNFVIYWSIRVVLPVTSILIFWAMYLSNPQMERTVVVMP